MEKKFKKLLAMKPILSTLLSDLNVDNKNGSKKYHYDIEEFELKLAKKLSNFARIREKRLQNKLNFIDFIYDLIKGLSPLDRSILLTIIFRNNYDNITWKTFNISKSTFYRRIRFLERIIYWCLFGE
ncbi:hypothetical protein [Mycoplasmopsis arginini]|uniref:hypothetical protein n=1 Tax=Mycoplasmopsis arginini TaxID=2094 RepID=UPI00249F85F0|nr:hypothetical protein [Mycoplasmopsis arginini]MDI3350273.1 hypothetical protein [Mycoplasmopsis arginini]MDI3350908.1 hypothetical protein [Mycoplasmopsis arginini]